MNSGDDDDDDDNDDDDGERDGDDDGDDDDELDSHSVSLPSMPKVALKNSLSNEWVDKFWLNQAVGVVS